MAITAEIRNDIIGLVVAAYNAAPGTTLLNELVAIISDGGTLDDVAIALTTSTTIPTTNVTDVDSDDFVSASDRWSGRYPAFQTPEEFATEWLGNLVPEASAEALAEGIAVVVGLLSGGASFADLLLQAQEFLSGTDETHAGFGSSAANFNNKVEAATHHTVTLELDGSASELQDVLVGVTSDDDSVDDANQRSGQFEEREDATINLTTEIDTVIGTIADDTVNGIITGGDDTTYNVADAINLGAGSGDAINVSLEGNDSNLAGQGADGVEILNITYRDTDKAADAVSADASGFDDHAAVWVRGSTNIGGNGVLGTDNDTVTVTGIDADAVVGVADNTSATDVVFRQDGSEDAITLAVGGGSTGDITLRDSAGEDGFDTVTIVTSGSSGTIHSLDGGSDFEELIITGDQGLTAIGLGRSSPAIPASVETIDASGNSGGVLVNATASRDLDATGGSGADTLLLLINGNEINRGMSVTGFETVSFDASGAGSEVNLGLIDGASILSIGGNAGSDLTLNNVTDGQLFVFAGLGGNSASSHNGLTVEMADDSGSSDSVTFTFNNRGVDAGAADQQVGTLTLDGIESVSITADNFDDLTIAGIEGDDLESISYAGDSDLNLTAAIDAPDLEEFDGSDATGDIDLEDALNNIDVEESEISTGSGNDRVTNTALTAEVIQTIDTGAGNDTFILNAVMEGSELAVDLGAGDDAIRLGDNASNTSNENITIDGGAGSDTVTVTASTSGNVTLDNIETILIRDVAVTHTAADAIAFADGDLGSVSITDISGNGLFIDATDGELDAGDASYLGAGRLSLLGADDEDDDITASNSGDVIDAGRGADDVTLGRGADIIVHDTGDGARPTAGVTGNTNAWQDGDTLTLAAGFDTVAGFRDGQDFLDLAVDQTGFSEGTFYGSNAANFGLGNDEFVALAGSLSGTAFTGDSDGADTLLLFDARSGHGAGADVEAIVLTGFAANNFTAADIFTGDTSGPEPVVPPQGGLSNDPSQSSQGITGTASNDTFSYVELAQDSYTLDVELGAGDDTFYLGNNGLAQPTADGAPFNVEFDGEGGTDTLNLTELASGGVVLVDIEVISIAAGVTSTAENAIAFSSGRPGAVTINDSSGNGLFINTDTFLDAREFEYTGTGSLHLVGAADNHEEGIEGDKIWTAPSGGTVEPGGGNNSDVVVFNNGVDIYIVNKGEGSAWIYNSEYNNPAVEDAAHFDLFFDNVSLLSGSQNSDVSAASFDVIENFTDGQDLLDLEVGGADFSLGTFDIDNTGGTNGPDDDRGRGDETTRYFGIGDNEFVALAGSAVRVGSSPQGSEEFFIDPNGNDTLVLFDSSAGSGSDAVDINAVILVGFAASNFSAADII